MSLASLLNEPCTITRRNVADGTDVDEYGNPQPTETSVNTVCYREQRTTTENLDGADIVTRDWLFMLPTGTLVGPTDKIVVAGDHFEVTGDPWAVRNPRTRTRTHVECTARQVT